MSGKTGRAALALTAAEEETLRDLARSRTAPVSEAERAKILLAYAANRSITVASAAHAAQTPAARSPRMLPTRAILPLLWLHPQPFPVPRSPPILGAESSGPAA